MYTVTVLPHGAKTPAGKEPLSTNSQDLSGLSVVRFVLPIELVSELDTWLSESLQPRFIEKPNKAIEEYIDPQGSWNGIEGLQVVYYVAASDEQLEKIEQFASDFSDLR